MPSPPPPSSSPPPAPRFDFDIDDYLKPFIPRPRLCLLPKPISRLLGYRSTPPKPLGSLLISLWAFLGAFASISLICLIFRALPVHGSNDSAPPIIIASFGASAILEYNSISSALAQPRNVLLGQALSSLIGVAITRAFRGGLSPPAFADLRWLAGALSVATASAAMGLTKTLHPPAGATALLAATTPQITDLGWYLTPLVVLGSVVMLLVACLVDNVQRQFPLYWWTELDLSAESPPPPPPPPAAAVAAVAAAAAVTRTDASSMTSTTTAAATRDGGDDYDDDDDRDLEKGSIADGAVGTGPDAEQAIRITERGVIVPDALALTAEEVRVLEGLRGKLRT